MMGRIDPRGREHDVMSRGRNACFQERVDVCLSDPYTYI